MKVLVAPDSFKGSLSASEVCGIVRRAIHDLDPRIRVDLLPLADGGEGTMEAIAYALQVKPETREVTGPMGSKVQAALAFSQDKTLAVMEMASASGLTLVPESERNPLKASSYGTGELLAAALDAGAERIVLGIGGSAVNDGGAGMLEALGFRLLDATGHTLPRGAESLQNLHTIDRSTRHSRLDQVTITVACDVVNPLLGDQGATAVYGPQKGVTPAMRPILERALTRWADCVEPLLQKSFRHHPGAGAAGGMGFSLISLLQAELQSGFEWVAEAIGLRERLLREHYDWILTGEGRVDAQSQQGKLLSRLGQLGEETRTPIIAFAGSLSGNITIPGIRAIFPIVRSPCSTAEAMHEADPLLYEAVTRVMTILHH